MVSGSVQSLSVLKHVCQALRSQREMDAIHVLVIQVETGFALKRSVLKTVCLVRCDQQMTGAIPVRALQQGNGNVLLLNVHRAVHKARRCQLVMDVIRVLALRQVNGNALRINVCKAVHKVLRCQLAIPVIRVPVMRQGNGYALKILVTKPRVLQVSNERMTLTATNVYALKMDCGPALNDSAVKMHAQSHYPMNLDALQQQSTRKILKQETAVGIQTPAQDQVDGLSLATLIKWKLS